MDIRWETLHEDADAVMFLSGNLMVTILRGAAKPMHLDKVGQHGVDLARRSPDGKSRSLIVINGMRNHQSLDPPMRAALARLNDISKPYNGGTADVLLGTGAGYSLVRSVISASTILAGTSQNIKIFSELKPGIAWVAERVMPALSPAHQSALERRILTLYSAGANQAAAG